MILNFGMHNCGPKLYYVYKKRWFFIDLHIFYSKVKFDIWF